MYNADAGRGGEKEKKRIAFYTAAGPSYRENEFSGQLNDFHISDGIRAKVSRKPWPADGRSDGRAGGRTGEKETRDLAGDGGVGGGGGAVYYYTVHEYEPRGRRAEWQGGGTEEKYISGVQWRDAGGGGGGGGKERIYTDG